MDVFISWSGSRSEKIAEALRDWLPKVIQSLDPWMSKIDIEKGTRWAQELATRLRQTKLGILCLTSENLAEPWLLFEAGALSKTLEDTYVIPYLFKVRPSELQGPLTQFQAVTADKGATREMVATINQALGENALSITQLDQAFEMWWPNLEKELSRVPDATSNPRPARSDSDMLEEILELTRIGSRSFLRSAQSNPNYLGPKIEVSRQGEFYAYRWQGGPSLHTSQRLTYSEAADELAKIRGIFAEHDYDEMIKAVDEPPISEQQPDPEVPEDTLD